MKSKADANQSDGQVTVNKSLLSIDYASKSRIYHFSAGGVPDDVHFREPRNVGLSARRRCRVQETKGTSKSPDLPLSPGSSSNNAIQTKKKRATRRQPETDPSEPSTSSIPPPVDTMEVDVKPVIPNMDANFVDDDDLQAVLAQSRRRKLTKKAKAVTAEEIAEKGMSLPATCNHLLYRYLPMYVFTFSCPGTTRGASCPRSCRGRTTREETRRPRV